VNTFLEKGTREFSEVALTLDLLDKTKPLLVPILVDENFEMSFEIHSLGLAVKNVQNSFKLADVSLVTNTDVIVLDGILGVDVIQCFHSFGVVPCLKGSAFKYGDSVIPFGNVEHFLHRNQAKRMYNDLNRANNDFQSCVNFVLSPVPRYQDPINDVISESQVEGNIDKMFSLESIGLAEDCTVTELDQAKVDAFANDIELKDGRYHVKLPWNEKIDHVPNNFCVARAVLSRVLARLKAKNLIGRYEDVLEQQLQDGILEEVSLQPRKGEHRIYIPHREVVKNDPTCTTKVRPVLNCSAKVGKEPSLNEAAFPGVNLMANMLNLLIGLRYDKYLVLSDIRKAFLQIKLATEEDRNRFCILWEKEGRLVVYRYTTIVFGYVASPFILNYVIKHHAANYPSDLCNHFLLNALYVDNLFMTGNDPCILNDLYRTAYSRMLDGGFDLRSWSSNCQELNVAFTEDGVGVDHGEPTERVLGYRYSLDSDVLFVDVENEDIPGDVCTKRHVLSRLAKCFDPLGLVNPITVRGKNLMREIWMAKLGWDDKLPEELKKTWVRLRHDLNQVSKYCFDRQALDSADDVTLVIFTDASKTNYGFTIYTVHGRDDDKSSNLLFSKTKVAPLKSKTLPTLELLAIFLAFKCLMNIIVALDRTRISRVYFATDSQIAISWILNKEVKTKNVFANNRVKDILQFQETLNNEHNLKCVFKFINSDSNPADLLTRGLTVRDFDNKFEFWKRGPEFIRRSPIDWPTSALQCLSKENKALVTCTVKVSDEIDDAVMAVSDFSSLDRLLGVTARLFYVAGLCKRQKLSRFDCLVKARRYWIAREQKVYFPEELKFLRSINKPKVIPNLVKDLNLFTDDFGVVRSKGRLSRCESLPYDVMHPILISRNSHFSRLLIIKNHQNCKHLGVNSTLNALRNQGFWLPKGRPLIKTVIKECVLCQKYNSNAYKYPKPSDFHNDKVNLLRPFNNVGVDFTGHFFVKFGESYIKMYLVIFTCLNIRAIHLELVPDMSTNSFLASFVRFTNRFGFPRTVYSDNAPTFSQAAKFLNSSFSDDYVSNFLARNNVRHVRIPLYSAWYGAAWERLIKVVKNCLHKSIGKSKIEYFQFLTLISDIQDAVNSRPLTSHDSADPSHTVISPNSFLKSCNATNLMFGQHSGGEIVKPTLTSITLALEKREEIMQEFKEIWYDEYLLSLREATRNSYEPSWENRIKIGDIVLVSSPVKPRPMWSLARVTKLFPGRDGKTRSVEVLRPDRSTGEYAISLLYPLEISLTSVPSYPANEPNSDLPHTASSYSCPDRPRRAAAELCRARLRGAHAS
jgi:hypothetical protein